MVVVLFFSARACFKATGCSEVCRVSECYVLTFLKISVITGRNMVECGDGSLLAVGVIVLPCVFLFTMSIFFCVAGRQTS